MTISYYYIVKSKLKQQRRGVFFERKKQMPPGEERNKIWYNKTRLCAHVTHHADAVLHVLLIYNVSLATENMYMYTYIIYCACDAAVVLYYARFLVIDATAVCDTEPRNNLYRLEKYKNYVVQYAWVVYYTRLLYAVLHIGVHL